MNLNLNPVVPDLKMNKIQIKAEDLDFVNFMKNLQLQQQWKMLKTLI